MIPRPFEYEVPNSISEAIALLKKYGEEAKVLAGGQSLIPLMKLRLASPEVIIDLNRIPGLEYVKDYDGYLRIGPLTRMAEIESSGLVRRAYPILSDAASQIADPLVRNVGTVGGNVAHGDPGNDMPSVMLALDADLSVQGEGGERTVPAREFYLGTFETALRQNEILTEIRVRTRTGMTGGAYQKLERRVGDFAIAGVAAHLRFDQELKVSEAGIGLTAVGPKPLLATEAMNHLKGMELVEELVEEAAELASKVADPTTDIRGTAEYKRAMVRVLTKRALIQASQRARSGAKSS